MTQGSAGSAWRLSWIGSSYVALGNDITLHLSDQATRCGSKHTIDVMDSSRNRASAYRLLLGQDNADRLVGCWRWAEVH